MKLEFNSIAPIIRIGSTVAKLFGGNDSIVFNGSTILLRSYPIAIDYEVPGMKLTASVSAKALSNAIKNMDVGTLDIRLTKTQMVITDGVRVARLKLNESGASIIPIKLPDTMEALPPAFHSVLSKAVLDGGGNDGVQFLDEVSVSQGKSELVISTIPKMPVFYLQKVQIAPLLELAISDLSVYSVVDSTVYFNDPGHCSIRCGSAIVPGAVIQSNINQFMNKVLPSAVDIFSGVMDETISAVLRRVLMFGKNDAEMGTAVRIIFDPESHTVRLLGENMDGAFEENTSMEYDGKELIDVFISTASLNELVGRPFSIKQRPDIDTGVWFVAVEGDTTYICGGNKA